jgi:hypothetical protein
VEIEIPPCLWIPIGDAISGSKAILAEFPDADPRLPFQIGDSVTQAKGLLKNPAPGTWYELPVNPAAGPAGRAACLKLPLYAWVPPGTAPPMPPVPPRILAEYAFNHMQLPTPWITTSPNVGASSYVNLATFAWVGTRVGNRLGKLHRVTTTASLRLFNGQTESVTVTADPAVSGANPQPVSIIVNGFGTAAENCGEQGSRYPVGQPPASSGPGVPPDCGVLWTTPTTGAIITVIVNYHVTWGIAQQTAPLRDIRMQNSTAPLRVREIQSVNNG